ncbi:hypothetical protein ATB96_11115 [Elizabethkingia ursingii]|nr:hypothetical protein ATB96_11115 [Elizabethkingia ursingii]
MAKRVANFEFKTIKFQEIGNSKNYYKPNLLNINGLKIRNIRKSFILPPSGVQKALLIFD